MKYGLKLIALVCLLMPAYLDAHPVTWKDGHAWMGATSNFATELMYHYSVSPKWSVGAHYMRFNTLDQSYLIGQSNWLLKRWYEDDAQANIYLLSGIGANLHGAGPSPIGYGGVQADWETRRWYTLAKAEYYGTRPDVWNFVGRLGVAPYIAEFDEIHTWLIVQVENTLIDGKGSTKAMPVIRVFKDNVLMEVGSDFSGDSFVALMVHF